MSAARSSLSSCCPWSRSSGSSASRSTAAEPSPSGATSRRRRTSRPSPARTTTSSATTRPRRRRAPGRSRRRTASRTVARRRPSASTSTRPTASRSTVDDRPPHREHVPRRVGMTSWAGHDRGDGAGRLPGHAPPAPGRSSSRSARSTTTGRPSTRPRPTSARATATSRSARSTSPGRTTGPATSTRARCRDIISGADGRSNKTLDYGEYIGQHNNGNHTALYGDVDTYLSGKDMPVAVVDDSGNFMGWAMFHVNSASGGSNKHINGYFLSSFASARLTVSSCCGQRLPALPRLVRPQADRLSARRVRRRRAALARASRGSTSRRRRRAGRVDDARRRRPSRSTMLALGGDPLRRRRRRRRPGRRAARAGPAGSQVTSQTSSQTSAQAALDELDRLDDDGRRAGRVGASAIGRGSAAGRRDGRSPRARRARPDRANTIRAERRPIERRRPVARSAVAEPAERSASWAGSPGAVHLARDVVGVDDDAPRAPRASRRPSTCRSRSARSGR